MNTPGAWIRCLKTGPDCVNRLPGAIHLPTKKKLSTIKTSLVKMDMTLKNFGRCYGRHYTGYLKRFFLLIDQTNHWPIALCHFFLTRSLRFMTLFQFLILVRFLLQSTHQDLWLLNMFLMKKFTRLS